MPKYSRQNKISEETKDDALKIARGTQRPGQTKEQTKMISQGIQKGIDLYKKQQKIKARELDKKLRKVTTNLQSTESPEHDSSQGKTVKGDKLGWILLAISWLAFATYLLLTTSFLK